jgi:UDP-GlcNAc:undecaprenyl-phosphate GlcNAc-1-phosphate transferase
MIISMGLTPVVIEFARRKKLHDEPNVRKVHSNPIPRIGGVVIFLSSMTLILPVLFLPNVIGQEFRNILLKIIVLLCCSAFVFVVGLIDDLKGLRARYKLFAQIIATLTVCFVGIRIHLIGFTDTLIIDFGWFSWPLTIFWIVGITNAVNLSDGLDGFAVGISAIACGTVAILSIYVGNPIMGIMMLALLGSLTGFLFFNFYPAKIFLGDGGCYFIGFIIASVSVISSTKSFTFIGLALPVLALGIPIFDTLFSMLRRFLERRSLFAPDRSHFHHRLLDLGLHHRHAVIIIYVTTFFLHA